MRRGDRLHRLCKGGQTLHMVVTVAWFALSAPLCAAVPAAPFAGDHDHPCPMEERSAIPADAGCWCDPGAACAGKLDDDAQGDDLHAWVPARGYPAGALMGRGVQSLVPRPANSRAGPPLFVTYQRFLE